MKIKPNKNMLYSVKAEVFNTNSKFGRTIHTTVVANNKEQAFEEAEKVFLNYINKMNKKHNENAFSFKDLTLE